MPIVFFAQFIYFLVVSRFCNGNVGVKMVAEKNWKAKAFSVRRGIKTRRHGNIPLKYRFRAGVAILTIGARTVGF